MGAREEQLKRILAQTTCSGDDTEKYHALYELSSLLQMNNRPAFDPGDPSRYYEKLLPEELTWEPLSVAEEAQIVEWLEGSIVAHGKSAPEDTFRAGLIYSLGLAKPWLALVPLLRLLRDHLDWLNEHELYQALLALEDDIQVPYSHPHFGELTKQLVSYDPRALLTTIRDGPWSDKAIAAVAHRLLDKIDPAFQ